MKYILFYLLFGTFVYGQDINTLRKNLGLAAEDKTLCSAMIEMLSTSSSKPIHVAYLGAYQTIWANHVLNPMTKLSTFNKGKKNIEKAIKLDNKNIEIRVIRYSIQTNAPKFLGYHEHRITDKKYIEMHLSEVKSSELNELIKAIL